jgi:hypothetical protein
MKTLKINIKEFSEIHNLDVIETTIGSNGYPEHLKDALIGFENFSQAKEIAEEYGFKIEAFHKKDGWALWERNNNTRYEAFKNDSSDFGDDYHEYNMDSFDDEADFISEEIEPFFESFKSFDDVEQFLESKKELWEKIQECEDDEVVITSSGRYFDTIKTTSMAFSHDTHNYVIGLIED